MPPTSAPKLVVDVALHNDEDGTYYVGLLGDLNKVKQPFWVEDGETLDELTKNIKDLVVLWGDELCNFGSFSLLMQTSELTEGRNPLEICVQDLSQINHCS